MRIARARLQNYKSFTETDWIDFGSGFTVIVGQNNTGKTALINALGQPIPQQPHRSQDTVPSMGGAPADPDSHAVIEYEMLPEELFELLPNQFLVSLNVEGNTELEIKNLGSAFAGHPRVACKFTNGNVTATWFGGCAEPTGAQQLKVQLDRANGTVKLITQVNSKDQSQLVTSSLVPKLKEKVYVFHAERLNIGACRMTPARDLQNNAANLASALHHLSQDIPRRFDRLVERVHDVFPEIEAVTIPLDGDDATIRVWGILPDSERADLSVPLMHSGTGVGQVLAILFVVLMSDVPQCIIIDEPQSFLHPGAVRKLLEILGSYPQHQFIFTTHSPSALAAVEPAAVLLLRKDGTTTQVKCINPRETQDLRLVLTDVGARLSDVFGADSILWVEGTTEEICFPRIIRQIAKRQLLGTSILGIVNTGDLDGRHKRRVLEIYSKLSRGTHLLPPALGFVFDREERSRRQMTDLRRESRKTVHFLQRRMFENYLLISEAIATVMDGLEGFPEESKTVEQITAWMEKRKWKSDYIHVDGEEQKTEELWLSRGNGAKLLADMFKTLSRQKVIYDKVRDGLALTEWLIENQPDALKGLADELVVVLESHTEA